MPRRPRIARVLAVTAALATLCALPSAASAAGTLSSTAITSIPFSATLTGYDFTKTGTVTNFAVVSDTRTPAPTAGWNLTVATSSLSTSSPVHTLPADIVSATGVGMTCGSGCTTVPTNSVTFPITITAGAAAVKLVSVAANTGTGTVNVSPAMALDLPGNAYTGTYSGTLTSAVVSGP